MKFSYLAFVAVSAVLISCGKEEPIPEPQPSIPVGNPNSSGQWGSYITVPDIDGSDDFAGALQTTNEGVYLEVSLNNSESNWIYRMNRGEEWIKCENVYQDYIDWTPSNLYFENTDEFSYFYFGGSNYGLIDINTGDPFELTQPQTTDYQNGFRLLRDNSTYENVWLITSTDVKVREWTESNQFNSVFTFPEMNFFYRAVADPTENCIWLTNGSPIIYQVYSTGDYNVWDLAAFTGVQATIGDIVFSNPPGHMDVYFKYGNSIMRIDERTTLQTVCTDPTIVAYLYDVDYSYLYTNLGQKINLYTGEIGTFYPDPSTFEDPALLSDYWNKRFQIGNSYSMAVLKKGEGTEIYFDLLTDDRLLRVPKTP